ncbi:hypothetical protein J6590_093987 [Homalodisca vitripennis]|nr:hypothetical protein J6590_024326 [Homalodisca vitripennis]KAG8279930.1 hypothetical protein J6590_093987 [Homalodisca vitripennis]
MLPVFGSELEIAQIKLVSGRVTVYSWKEIGHIRRMVREVDIVSVVNSENGSESSQLGEVGLYDEICSQSSHLIATFTALIPYMKNQSSASVDVSLNVLRMNTPPTRITFPVNIRTFHDVRMWVSHLTIAICKWEMGIVDKQETVIN